MAVDDSGEFAIAMIVYIRRYTLGVAMKLQIAKWGNSLAVRLPVEIVKVVELHEGDSVEAEITPTGEIRLKADRRFDKAAFLDRVRKLHENMPMTEPVVEQIRHEARY